MQALAGGSKLSAGYLKLSDEVRFLEQRRANLWPVTNWDKEQLHC